MLIFSYLGFLDPRGLMGWKMIHVHKRENKRDNEENEENKEEDLGHRG